MSEKHDYAETYQPRFVFEISEAQQARVNKLIGNYGWRKKIFSPILDDVLDLIEECGPVALGILVTKTMRPRDMLPSLAEANKEAKKINGQS